MAYDPANAKPYSPGRDTLMPTPTKPTPTTGRLPPEPQRKDYPDDESFLEARDGWRHRVGHIVSLVQGERNRRLQVSQARTRQPDLKVREKLLKELSKELPERERREAPGGTEESRVSAPGIPPIDQAKPPRPTSTAV
jgi:hypothetical protein